MDGWSCLKCTFYHRYPATRCSMCNELRTTKEHMRAFVQGVPVPQECGGKPLPKTNEEKKAKVDEYSAISTKIAPSKVKPVKSLLNPYAKRSTNPMTAAPKNSVNVASRAASVASDTTESIQNHDYSSSNPAIAPPATESVAQMPYQKPQTVPKPLKENANFAPTSAKRPNPFTAAKPPPRLDYSAGPVPYDPQTITTWIYPADETYSKREYQFEITQSAILHNTLVSLPTGLGKTLIAAVVMYNYYRWFPTGKIIFMAPTLPLVNQQVKACYDIMGIPAPDTAVLTGKTNADRRSVVWNEKRVFFCTPQTVERDLESMRCPASKVVCIVFDEAHKATGDYSYVKVQKIVRESGAHFRVLGLSATPGTNIKAIQQVIDALHISKIEVRSDEDPSVKPYIHGRETELVVVPQALVCRSIVNRLNDILVPLLEKCRKASPRWLGNSPTPSTYQVLKAREECSVSPDRKHFIPHLLALYQFVSAKNDLQKQGVNIVRPKLAKLKNERQRGVLASIVKGPEFAKLWEEVVDATQSKVDSKKPGGLENNPKLEKLQEILLEHFNREQAAGGSSRAIVFSQFRDSVSEIVNILESCRPTIRARHFIGQGNNSKGDSDSSQLKGMKQQEQFQVIREFRDDVYNVLVCTCIGEEGLDIGEVDLIVNFDTLRSPIRMIQRTGRTGRKRSGRVVCLVAEGPEEKTYRASQQSERTLIHALKNPRSFSTHPVAPLFPMEPSLLEESMQISQNFHMSQVEGHDGQNTSRSVKISLVSSSSRWKLNKSEEEACTKELGQWWRPMREKEVASSINVRKYFLACTSLSKGRSTIHSSSRCMTGSMSSILWSIERSHGTTEPTDQSSSTTRILVRGIGMNDIGNVFPVEEVSLQPVLLQPEPTIPPSSCHLETSLKPKSKASSLFVEKAALPIANPAATGPTSAQPQSRIVLNKVESLDTVFASNDQSTRPRVDQSIPSMPAKTSSELQYDAQDPPFPQPFESTGGAPSEANDIVENTFDYSNKSDVQEKAQDKPKGMFDEFTLPPQDDDSSSSDESEVAFDVSFEEPKPMEPQQADPDPVVVKEDAFQLPTQDSSSDEDSDEEDGTMNALDEGEFQLTEEAESQHLNLNPYKTKCNPTRAILDTPDDTDDPVKPRFTKPQKFSDQADQLESLADTPPAKIKASVADCLQHTPLEETKKKAHDRGNIFDIPVSNGVIDDIHCAICKSENSPDQDPIVLCDGAGCNLAFHTTCYSIPQTALESDEDWRCDVCDYKHHGNTIEPECVLCNQSNHQVRPMKRRGQIWKHIQCPAKPMNGQIPQNVLKPQNGKPKAKSILKKKHYYRDLLDDEAGIDSDEDIEGDDEEEDMLRAIEEEEDFHSSFINDASQLSGDGDLRQHIFESERERINQFATPMLNQRNKRQKLGDYSGTPSSAPDSEKGLGNMHFIRSVLEHHRNGGTAEEIEDFYQEMEEDFDSEEEEDLIPERPPPKKQTVEYLSSDDDEESVVYN